MDTKPSEAAQKKRSQRYELKTLPQTMKSRTILFTLLSVKWEHVVACKSRDLMRKFSKIINDGG